MNEASPQAVRLADYTAPPFLIETTRLEFELGEEYTTVHAELALRRNSQSGDVASALRLDGEQLMLIDLSLDDDVLAPEQYVVDDHGLTVHTVPDCFVLKSTVRIDPKNNTSLEGLYLSSGNFCTQCEAEGFRKITFYLDRPDVLSRFTTTIHADTARYPVLLSNGNLVAEGEHADGRRWVRWEDPFDKPSYLFALVAGTLSCVEDQFNTQTGREVTLRIFLEPHNADKCGHAMASLKRAMRWDEDVYGLEYDLDIFMIVAVDDFNMGAMENKGLNIFNSKYVLAKPETATDADFIAIEAVIAHEYFHNWTGNRVTCRDWFQLSLKEGLTVFRDQEFSADMASRAVKRIQDVRILRAHQFPEDAGPMAHPVRPDSYIEINNFYTVTIYNKGAEVIRMIHTLLGAHAFRRGMDLYFERHDGQAVTTEDFLNAMEHANGVDLMQFRRWYDQAGTPLVKTQATFDAQKGQYELSLEQSCDPTPGQPTKENFHIPVRMALLDATGNPIGLTKVPAGSHDVGVLEYLAGGPATETLISLKESKIRLRVTGLTSPPVASLGRGFSAPVRMEAEHSSHDLAFLMGHDTDPFNRWDAAQEYAFDVLLNLYADPGVPIPGDFVEAVGRILGDRKLDPALAAEALRLPGEAILVDRLAVNVDPELIHAVRQTLRRTLAAELRPMFAERYHQLQTYGAYEFTGTACAARSLKNVCLSYLVCGRDEPARELCVEQFQSSNNMTDTLGALACLANDESPARLGALAQFREKWKEETLVLDKWFVLRATSTLPGTLDEVRNLMSDAAFDITNPNKVRSLIGAFCHANPRHFHAADGEGYEFLHAQALHLDGLNPQIAARLLGAFSQWRRYEPNRKTKMRGSLEAILAAPGLSRDSYEVVSKMLGLGAEH